jgi:hypothetical protein
MFGSSIRWMTRRMGASSSMTSTVEREDTSPPLGQEHAWSLCCSFRSLTANKFADPRSSAAV